MNPLFFVYIYEAEAIMRRWRYQHQLVNDLWARTRPLLRRKEQRSVSCVRVTWQQCKVLNFQETSGSEPASLSEFLLTAADLLSLRMRARLVVLSSCHTREQHGWASADGVAGLTRALLAAGVQCVLLALWPVPDTAAKILLRAFYSALLQVINTGTNIN